MNNIKDHENLNNKKILLRLDLNVPLKEGLISDETRIDKIIPTIKFLIKKNSKIIVISHVGRPKGEKNKFLSLRPICENIGKNFYSKIEIFSKGMKIFNFHPLNVYINSSKKTHREFLFKIPDLVSVEEDFVKQFINKESFGSCDFLIELIKKLKKQKSNFFKVNNFAKKLYENK